MSRQPPENKSVEACALREAAYEWGQYAHRPAVDDSDREGQRLNRRLLYAAMRYTARAVTGLSVAEFRRFYKGSVPAWREWLRKNGHQLGAAIRSYTGIAR